MFLSHDIVYRDVIVELDLVGHQIVELNFNKYHTDELKKSLRRWTHCSFLEVYCQSQEKDEFVSELRVRGQKSKVTKTIIKDYFRRTYDLRDDQVSVTDELDTTDKLLEHLIDVDLNFVKIHQNKVT
eukprot:UN32461